MDPRFSVPTDNIYKFFALFGLALIIASMLSFVYVYDQYYKHYVDLKEQSFALEEEEIKDASTQSRLAHIETLMQTDVKNKDFYLCVIAFAGVLGVISAAYGLIMWKVYIQPREDELTELRILQLRKELKDSGINVPKRSRRNSMSE